MNYLVIRQVSQVNRIGLVKVYPDLIQQSQIREIVLHAYKSIQSSATLLIQATFSALAKKLLRLDAQQNLQWFTIQPC